MDSHVVGVLGGGQLGRMLTEAANRLNIEVAALDSDRAPAKQIALSDKHVTGSFAKASDVKELASRCDVLTYEIEHVDTKVLEELEGEKPFINGTQWSRIQPSWKTVRTIQDKFVQKQHFAKFDIPTAKSIAVGTSQPQGLKDIADRLGYPLMLKSRTEAYDGRGNYPVRSVSDIEPALKALENRPLYAEKWCDFKLELAVVVVKVAQEDSVDSWESSTLAYPTVETIHEDSICKLVYAPARNVSSSVAKAGHALARRAVSTFPGTGVFGVELFLLKDNSLVVNEIAPRPHNSGHYTIEACHMSQYEAQIRAILPGLAPTIAPEATEMVTTAAIMLNILGGPEPDSHLLVAKTALTIPGAKIHLYGKGDGRPGRKMGHITILGKSMSECERKIHPLIQMVDAVRAHRTDSSLAPATSIASIAAELQNTHPIPAPQPVIAVVMGSDTDLATLRPGLTILDTMDIPYEVHITSAHRTPQYMLDFGKVAAARGFKAIIAAAGGAAHLPGMMASETPVPVIGVPVKASSMDGLDSLLSIVQMPRGVPVATVGIGNSVNAAILAARIVGTSDTKAREWVANHLQQMDDENMEKEHRLQREGWKVYKKLDG
ncbi:phosphoribosylaminoimidazole carboxylase, ATPase subunit [Rhinocladiella mackenziei CBS 650.93]|uniref:Phosphoribosylaminoimidazole carboxylase n=1 Tax=Rhinocladiella mackenziei CBS 650.93 TaxID=1442369 RepID=A0A0D2ICY7_9EURO|nr:phosphoribosylaminoimidazole carboxylase, ATPase subunit [Rhinocladiella mackenziei CBS 650.93]KIX03714.1 phosphoribosylaminoimidazole carboxylase, ATPase subunit [Rhinocladiella mackenziei CBS 650.93]